MASDVLMLGSKPGVGERAVNLIVPIVAIVVLLMLAYVIGDTCRAIGTGEYLALAAQANLTPAVIPAVLFVLSDAAAFSTGTSWGTWTLMMPIALPMAESP